MTNEPDLLSNEIDENCGCRRVVISHLARRAVFSELDLHERYFPMVAKEADFLFSFSFYGTPPEAVQPLAERLTNSIQPAQHHGGRQDMPHEDPSHDTVRSHDVSEDEQEQHQPRNQTTRSSLHAEWEQEQEKNG